MRWYGHDPQAHLVPSRQALALCSRSRSAPILPLISIRFLLWVFTLTCDRWAFAETKTPDVSRLHPQNDQHSVIPILLRHCTACHGRNLVEAGLDLRTVSSILRGGSNGVVVVAGDPGQSRLITRLQADACPPKKRLVEAGVKPISPSELDSIQAWIRDGCQTSAPLTDLAGTPSDPLVHDRDRQFWSFRPPSHPIPPPSSPDDESSNPIDAFLAQKLMAVRLHFAPEARKEALLRRLAYDLTGLPPSPDRLAAFLADGSPQAYTKQVDHYLASPQYGERWGRYWLDVAGYSDTEGRREQHLPRAEAYRYRDYVIRSMNADKPYDRFLLEQIAGDELADYQNAKPITQEIQDNLVATAFLRLGPDPTWANITGFVPDRLEVIADAIDVLGSGVMGLTLKCARCHDHKFDPLPQRDYFRLVDLLKGALDEYNWLKPDLRSFGGAANVGPLKERTLPHVADTERQAYDSAVKAGKKPAEPRIAALWDQGEPSPTYVYRRGDPEQSGMLVTGGVPAVLLQPGEIFRVEPPWPGAKSTGRRLALARWLTRPDHPMTARVMVNRVWKHHMGRGLVKNLGDFGHAATPPTHPELLDWLATDFATHGWSLKRLHRQIVTSRAYRQSSDISMEAQQKDPENEHLSRMSLRRLEAEAIWDASLSIADRLDLTPSGPPVFATTHRSGVITPGKAGDRWRRSIYGEQRRRDMPTLWELFDPAQLNPNCLERAESIVAPQALHLMNDEAQQELAEHFARRLFREAGDQPENQIRQAYLLAFARTPTPSETQLALSLLSRPSLPTHAPSSASKSPQDEKQRGLILLCHALMNAAEFIYIP